MDLQVNKNNDKSWIWDCPADYSEDVAKPSADVYAIRFNSAEGAFAFLSFTNDSQTLFLCFVFCINSPILLLNAYRDEDFQGDLDQGSRGDEDSSQRQEVKNQTLSFCDTKIKQNNTQNLRS